MVDVELLLWVWVLAGCFALYAHGAHLREKVDLGGVIFLVVTWPWWLSQHTHGRNQQRSDRNENFAPIRIDTTDKEQRRR